MTPGDWVGIVTASGVWSATAVGFLYWLHGKRGEQLDGLRKLVSTEVLDLTTEIRANHADAVQSRRDTEQAHLALRASITDLAHQVASTYVSKPEYAQGLAVINENVTGVREESREGFAGVHRRVDELFRGVEWRRNGGTRPNN